MVLWCPFWTSQVPGSGLWDCDNICCLALLCLDSGLLILLTLVWIWNTFVIAAFLDMDTLLLCLAWIQITPSDWHQPWPTPGYGYSSDCCLPWPPYLDNILCDGLMWAQTTDNPPVTSLGHSYTQHPPWMLPSWNHLTRYVNSPFWVPGVNPSSENIAQYPKSWGQPSTCRHTIPEGIAAAIGETMHKFRYFCITGHKSINLTAGKSVFPANMVGLLLYNYKLCIETKFILINYTH